jgi:PAS domain S-box-containing protein
MAVERSDGNQGGSQCSVDRNENRDEFKVSFDCAPVGLAHVHPDGSWLYVNPRLCEMLGYSHDELTGLRFQDVTYRDDLAADEEYVLRMLAGEIDRYQMEKRYVRKNGDLLWVIMTVSLVRDHETGNPLRFITAVEDISERKHLEQKLRNSEERLRRKAELIDLSRDAIFAHTYGANRIIYWSEGAMRTYGWTREEAEGCVAYELLQTEFPSCTYAELIGSLETTDHWEGDLIHTGRDGEKIVVSSRWGLQRDPHDRHAVAVLEVNRDVTEKRRLEAERAERLEEQRHIAEMLQKSLLMTPPPEMHPGLAVKAVYQGAEEDILVGGDFFDIFAVTENRIGLTVGDATGKGLEAALYTAELKFALRAFLRDLGCPAQALGKLNNFVAQQQELYPTDAKNSYAAVAVAIVDTGTGAVRTSTAGAERPIIIRHNGEVVESTIGGPLLGAVHDYAYAVFIDEIQDNDVLLLTTDGLVEARTQGRHREFFGTDRLVAAVRAELDRAESLAEAGHFVVEQVRQFAGGKINDDVCLLLARRSELKCCNA